MGKIKNTRVLASDPETTSAPRFNFRQYRVGDVYHNDGNDIDFVTDNKSLYVCLVESVQASKENIAEQEGLLKLVSQGEQGVPGANGSNGTPGVTPRIDAHFDGKQMIVTVNGAIKAVSPDLGGPSWKPVVEGTTLSWELTTDRYSPAPIDLTTLRPISEHPILLRTNSDNTKYDWETSGPANYIQWKYEGDEYWNNLISISELMNLALAGVSFWYNEDTQEWHFGHKEVIRASYTADKNGRKIISDVELGDILFDAGAVPMPNYEFDIQEIQEGLEQIQTELENYATKDWVEGKGYLTGVDLDDYAKKSEISGLTDAYTKAESDAKYQPKGNYLTAHQPIKTLGGASLVGTEPLPLVTINNQTILRNGNINIPDSVDLTGVVKSVNNVHPDANGNVTLSIGNLIDLTPYVKKEDLATINNQVLYNGGNFELNGGEIISGLQDIQFRVISGELQYRKQTNNSWGSYVKIMDVSSISGGEHVTLSIHDGKLWISYNNGTEQEVGSVGGGTGNGFVDVSISGNVLTFTRQDNTTKTITLPTGLDSTQVQQMINNALSGLNFATEDWVMNYTYSKGQVYTKAEADELFGGGGGQLTVEYKHTFTLYQRNNIPNDGTPPVVPSTTDFTWDGASAVLTDTHAGTAFASPWLNSPENRDAANNKIYLWATVATYSSKTGIMGEWSNPICFTGANGEEGADGDGIEFVYHLGEVDAPNLDYLHAFKGNNSKSFTSKTQALDSFWKTEDSRDWLPGDGDALGNSHWTDNPTGISDETGKHIEWVAVRTSTYDATIGESVWTEFSDPFIWSMWGEDGMDGDGVEYIFYVSPENTSENSYYTIDNEGKYHLEDDGGAVWPPTTAQEIASISNYQEPDWYPGNEQAAQGWDRNWTDNPIGISADRPYEWVSIRKRVNEVWQPFSEPALWAKYPKDGTAKNIYTSYIFTRTEQDISTFVLSDDIIPEDIKTYEDDTHKVADYEFTYGNGQKIVWSDTVPSTSTAQVWMSLNHINDDSWDQGWTSPSKLGDNPGFQVEYCASETIAKALPDLNDYIDETSEEGIDEAAIRSYMSRQYNEIWGDENDISEPVWMATASKRNGVWTAWAYAKIKGEKGEAGTSVRIKHTVEYASDLSAFVPRPGNENSASVGDCYIVLTGTLNPSTPAFGQVTAETYSSSHIWSYGGEDSTPSDDTNVHMYGFDDLGEFANITPNNVYMRFARLATESEQGTTTTSIAQVPVVIGGATVNKWLALLASNTTGPFIGLYVGESESQNIADYKWSKWDGEDYYGMESIFLKLEEDLTPTRPRLNLIGVSGNNTKITGFTTRDKNNGTIVNVSLVDVTTDTTNYKTFDYVPIVQVYDGNSSREEHWYDTPQDIYDNTTTKYNCWQCTRNTATGVYEWSDPIIYIPNVEDGTDGKDGAYEESVYLTENTGSVQRSAKWAYDKATSSFKTATTNGVFDWADALPLATTQYDSANSLPAGLDYTKVCWTDNPVGVDEDHKYEWIITRKITYLDSDPHTPQYGDFNAPRLRSRFGKDGIDGDGLEYVFWAVSEANHTAIVAYNAAHPSALLTPDDSAVDSNGRNNTQSEYLPLLKINGTTISEAVDDYVKPTAEFKYTYASKRKYDGSVKTWSFGPVHLWDEYVDVSANTSCAISYNNDMDPVPVDENYIPLSDSIYYATYFTMRHVLDIKRPEVIKVGDTVLIDSWTRNLNNYTGSYSGAGISYNGVTISGAEVTYYGDNNCGYLRLTVSLPRNATASTTPFKDDRTVVIPLTFATTGDPIYTGVGEIYLNPTTSSDIYQFGVVSDPIIYKSEKDSVDYNPNTVDFTIQRKDGNLLKSDLSKIVLTVKYDGANQGDTINLANYLPASSTWKEPGEDMSDHITYTVNIPSKPYSIDITQYAAEDGHALDKFIVELTLDLASQYAVTIIRKWIDCYVGPSSDPEQECQRVSIVYPGQEGPEGRGIDSIDHKYYYNEVSTLTDQELDALPASSWLDQRNDAGRNGKYVYIRTTITYTDGDVEVEYSVEYVPNDGADGTDGTSIPYTYRGEFETGVTYYNNSQRKDIVKYGSKYYIRKEEYNGQSDSSWNASRWTEFEGQYENIATGLLFAETGVIQNLAVSTLITDNAPNKRITINDSKNNAILGYSQGSNTYGIKLSGDDIEDVFRMEASTTWGNNSSSLEYHYSEQGAVIGSVYDNIGTSGDGYTSSLTFSYTGTSGSTSIRLTNGPDLSWDIIENGISIGSQIDENSLLWLPDMKIMLLYNDNSKFTTLGSYSWNDQQREYNFVGAGFVTVPRNTNFKLVLIPISGAGEEGWWGANYDGVQKINGDPLSAAYCELTITSEGSVFSYDYGTGNGTEGVTIAPNGILVYFDSNNYFRFTKVGNDIRLNLVYGGNSMLNT